jgi:hypothetical protein
MAAAPPPEVAAAAAIVDGWLKGDPARSVSDADFAKMSARDRIDYARQFPQEQFQKKDAPR